MSPYHKFVWVLLKAGFAAFRGDITADGTPAELLDL
jgi:hypothetical protein